MKKTLCAAAVMVLLAASAYAQSPIKGKSLELAGTTGVTFSRQSVTAASGGSGSVNNDTTAVGVGLIYYLSRGLGVGIAGAYQSASVSSSDGTSTGSPTVSSSQFGPLLRIRFPVSDRTAFNLTGSGGIAKMSLGGATSENASNGDSDAKFVSAGAGLSFFVLNAASLNVGVQYQKSWLTQTGTDMNSSGLVAAFGFSIYFNPK